MAIVYECDACGKREEATYGKRPQAWFERDIFVADEDGNMAKPKRIVACSGLCKDSLSQKYNVDNAVIPNKT